METLCKQPGASIRKAGEDRAGAKAVYRMPGNERFDREATLRWMAEYGGTILAVQNTTRVNYNAHLKTEGTGYISDKTQGGNVHSCLVVACDGLVLGVLEQRGYKREEVRDELAGHDCKKARPTEEKESFRWRGLKSGETLERSTADPPPDIKAGNVSLRSYLRKIPGKSALLFSLVCYAGAHGAKASVEVCRRLRRTGYNIGIAFQIIDDILDYTGNEKLVREPLGNDITTGLVTLPVFCALSLDSSGTLMDIFSRPAFTAEEAARIYNLVRQTGRAGAAGRYAETYTGRALGEIAALSGGKSRDMLETLTRRLLIRKQ